MMLNSLPQNDGSTLEVGAPLPCEQKDIIPIFPVRYALADFNPDLKSLDYPALTDLLNTPSKHGLTTRLLSSGWVFIYVEEGSDTKQEKNSEAKPSYKKLWHIFYYDATGEHGGRPGKFTKYKWNKGSADSRWMPYKAKGATVERDFVFVPCSVSKVFMAFSPKIWPAKVFDDFMADASKRKNHMQEISNYPQQPGPQSAPLVTLSGSRPSRKEAKQAENDNPEALTFMPAEFVAEFSTDQKQQQENSDKFIIGASAYRPHESRDVKRVRQSMSTQREIGTVVALHDPLGIARDLGSLHMLTSMELLHDIQSNTYAYSTYQAIENALAPVLPESKHPLATNYKEIEKQVRDYNISHSRRGGQRSLPHPRRSLTDEEIREYKKQLQERRDFEQAMEKLKQVREATGPLKEAMDGLHPEFFKLREQLAEKTKERDEDIKHILALCNAWLKAEGPGKIKTYIALLSDAAKADIEADEIDAMELALESIAQALHGLQTSRPGRLLQGELLVDNDQSLWKDVLTPLTEKSLGWGAIIYGRLGNVAHNGQFLREAVDNFSTVASAPLIKVATNEVFPSFGPDKTTTVMGEALAEVIRKKIDDTDSALAKINNMVSYFGTEKTMKMGAKTVTLAEVLEVGKSVDEWDKSINAKFFKSAEKMKLPALTFGGKTITATELGSKLDGIGGGVALFAIGADTLFKQTGLQSTLSARTTASELLAKNIEHHWAYRLAAITDASYKIIGRSIDADIAKGAGALARRGGINTAALNARLGKLAQSTSKHAMGKFGLALGKGLLKVGGLLAISDVVINSAKAYNFSQKGDYDAAAFAATGAVGGVVLLCAMIPGVNVVALTAVGLALVVTGIIGVFSTQDERLTTWVKTGFWGGRGKYQYWGGVDRERFVAIFNDGTRKEKFEAQLAISTLLASENIIRKTVPIFSQDDIENYYEWEMSEFNNISYQPTISYEGNTVSATLPGFLPGISQLEIKLIERIKDPNQHPRKAARSPTMISRRHSFNYPSKGWRNIDGKLQYDLPPSGRKQRLEYSYYPFGKGEDKLVIPTVYQQKDNKLEKLTFGSYKFGYWDR